MDQIKELGNIIQKENPGFYNELIQTDSKKGMLFRAVMEGIVSSDKEASLLIYGKVDEGKKYQMLKRNVKEQLISQVNSVNNKNHHSFTLIESDCREKLTLIANLLSNNVFHNAEKLLQQVIRKAEKFYLYNVLKEAAVQQRQIFSIKGFPEQVIEWNEKVIHYSQQDDFGIYARGATQFFKAHFIHQCSLLKELSLKAEKDSDIIREKLKESYSPVLELSRYEIQIFGACHRNKYELLPGYIRKIHNLMKKYTFIGNKVLNFNLLLMEGRSFLVSDRLTDAGRKIKECLESSDYKSFLKFEVQALNYSLNVKTEDYETAGEIVNEVFNAYEFKLFHPEAKASWYIRKAYLYFIYYARQDVRSIRKYTPEYASSNLLMVLDNNCKKLSKDKLGYNIQYLIIRLLLVWQNTKEETYYIGKNLQLYYYRNLKDLNELRIKHFFKYLASIAINEFLPTEITERKTLFMQKFQNTGYANKYDINELVPFDRIFDYLIEK